MTLKLMRRPQPTVFSTLSLSVLHGNPAPARSVSALASQLPRQSIHHAIVSHDASTRGNRAGRNSPDTRYFSNLTRRCLAHVRDDRSINDIVWFTSSQHLNFPQLGNDGSPSGLGEGRQPPDERTLKLGKTIQTLHTLLPHLLASPLPQEILSPQITLHLFPSTHPHLPTVSGKIAYNAALWTAPVAWGRVPVVGNVKLIILSERMIKNNSHHRSAWSYNNNNNNTNEKLIVKWRTCGKSRPRSRFMATITPSPLLPRNQVDKITEFLGTSGQKEANKDKEFEGLFIFEFDTEGRIAKHVIEHAQEGRNWEGMPRVISVTDWLLGLARGRGREEEAVPGLAWSEGCYERESQGQREEEDARVKKM